MCTSNDWTLCQLLYLLNILQKEHLHTPRFDGSRSPSPFIPIMIQPDASVTFSFYLLFSCFDYHSSSIVSNGFQFARSVLYISRNNLERSVRYVGMNTSDNSKVAHDLGLKLVIGSNFWLAKSRRHIIHWLFYGEVCCYHGGVWCYHGEKSGVTMGSLRLPWGNLMLE